MTTKGTTTYCDIDALLNAVQTLSAKSQEGDEKAGEDLEHVKEYIRNALQCYSDLAFERVKLESAIVNRGDKPLEEIYRESDERCKSLKSLMWTYVTAINITLRLDYKLPKPFLGDHQDEKQITAFCQELTGKLVALL